VGRHAHAQIVAGTALGIAVALTVASACKSYDEAGSDAPDASTDSAGDTNAEAADVADAGATKFCERSPDAALCLDFDEGDPAGTGFATRSGNYAIDTDSGLVVSPPASLVVHGPPTRLERVFPGGVKDITLGVQMRFGGVDGGAPPFSNFVIPLEIIVEGSCVFRVQFIDNRLTAERALADGGPYQASYPLVRVPVIGIFSRYELHVRVVNGKLGVSLSMDGKSAVDEVVPDDCPNTDGDVRVAVGLFYGPADLDVRFDDLLLELR